MLDRCLWSNELKLDFVRICAVPCVRKRLQGSTKEILHHCMCLPNARSAFTLFCAGKENWSYRQTQNEGRRTVCSSIHKLIRWYRVVIIRWYTNKKFHYPYGTKKCVAQNIALEQYRTAYTRKQWKSNIQININISRIYRHRGFLVILWILRTDTILTFRLQTWNVQMFIRMRIFKP